MRATDSTTTGFTAKAEPGSDAYKERVAEPVMNAVDALPKPWRDLVREFGYVDVYLAKVRGYSVERVRAQAAANGGWFEVPK